MEKTLKPTLDAVLTRLATPPSTRSDCKDNSTGGAALNEVTQRIGRFGQREGLSHDRSDRTGFKQ
jgi:hypothetical protein